jgi:hypothetical protein
MRTNIVIDDDLMEDALKLTGLRTKREAVELGLKTLVRIKEQEGIRRVRGKLQWEGDFGKGKRGQAQFLLDYLHAPASAHPHRRCSAAHRAARPQSWSLLPSMTKIATPTFAG